MQQLGRLLLAGYGLAAAGGIAAYQAGSGLLVAVVVFWIGGAVAVAALAILVTPFLAARPASAVRDDAALVEALRAWEEDRLSDIPAASQPSRRDGARAG